TDRIERARHDPPTTFQRYGPDTRCLPIRKASLDVTTAGPEELRTDQGHLDDTRYAPTGAHYCRPQLVARGDCRPLPAHLTRCGAHCCCAGDSPQRYSSRRACLAAVDRTWRASLAAMVTCLPPTARREEKRSRLRGNDGHVVVFHSALRYTHCG